MLPEDVQTEYDALKDGDEIGKQARINAIINQWVPRGKERLGQNQV